MKVAGIMSGTSADGIDVALVDIRGGAFRQRINVLAHDTVPYPKAVRDRILGVSNAQAHIGDIARLHTRLGDLYAEAVARVCRNETIDLIGCHGQTIYHDGDGRTPTTLQLGDGSVIAGRAGVPVVSDFRTADIAAGGRGAPLVPYVDYLLFRDRKCGRVALNIGGIANITAIPPAGNTEDVVAFDTGPGNMVVDALAAKITRGRARFDSDGRLAASGKVSKPLLGELLADPFFRRHPPKTTGREQFGNTFLQRLLGYNVSLRDLLATATALTPAAIALGIHRFVDKRMTVDEIIVSGGGSHNPRMMAHLAAFLPGKTIRSSSEFGIDPDHKEAVAFAVLAYETWHRRPSNLPSATGAKRPAVLGKISPAG